MGPTMMDSSQTSPLLRLPGEVRNRVYRYALVHQSAIMLRVKDVRHRSSKTSRLIPGHPALLKVCRTTMEEARAIYYSENTFCFTESTMNAGAISTFVEMQKHPNVKIHKINMSRIVRYDSSPAIEEPALHAYFEVRLLNDHIEVGFLSQSLLACFIPERFGAYRFSVQELFMMAPPGSVPMLLPVALSEQPFSSFDGFVAFRAGQGPYTCICLLSKIADAHPVFGDGQDLLRFLMDITPLSYESGGDQALPLPQLQRAHL